MYAHTIIPEDSISIQSFNSDTPGVFSDKAVSGWNKPFLSRPAGNAINIIVQPGDHIVCYSIDRLARNVRDFANTTHHFMQKGVHLHYISEGINTSTANGKLQAHIRAAVAQWHSDITSERVREANIIKNLGFGTRKSEKTLPWEGSEFDFTSAKGNKAREYNTTYRYERASDISQYTSGLGLEQQAQANEKYARMWCSKTGSKDGGVFKEDAISAFCVPFHERPKGKELLSIVKPGDDIVIYRSDRAWRSTKDAITTLESLTARGIYVHIVKDGIHTDTDFGLDWLAIMSAVAQLESSMKRKRKMEVNEHLKKSGRPVGEPPKGWKIVESNGKKRLQLDMKKCARTVAVWILRQEEGLSRDKVATVMRAWRCRDNKKRMTIKSPTNGWNVKKEVERAEFIRSKVSPASWEKILDKAWEVVRTPIEPKYWNKSFIKWDYNETVLGIEPLVE